MRRDGGHTAEIECCFSDHSSTPPSMEVSISAPLLLPFRRHSGNEGHAAGTGFERETPPTRRVFKCFVDIRPLNLLLVRVVDFEKQSFGNFVVQPFRSGQAQPKEHLAGYGNVVDVIGFRKRG